jgi:hypothetical protein
VNSHSDLLLLRLGALNLDVIKVSSAVERAGIRSHELHSALNLLQPCQSKLRAVSDRLQRLFNAMEQDDVRDFLDGQELSDDLKAIPTPLAVAIKGVQQVTEFLEHAKTATVQINDKLAHSLNDQCSELRDKISVLERDIRRSPAEDHRKYWKEYQDLLDNVARPVFVEYVDFLGGLTVRESGLDDSVCDMTAALLTRFSLVTERTLTLPLPARHAALGTALNGLVLLGFPEWSIWGIPLVGHEIGLGYAKFPLRADELAEIVKQYTPECGPPSAERDSSAEEYLHQLIADALATYILGFSYACASMLLRLNPRHDVPGDPTKPRDIDRARVIMMTLKAGGRTAPSSGGSFSEALERLQEIWNTAVLSHAGPKHADTALAEAKGPPPEDDWLDDFTATAVSHFARSSVIRPYDNERWRASDGWLETMRGWLESRDTPNPDWVPPGVAVVDVLNAAWRLRVMESADPDSLAKSILDSWSKRKQGGA